MKMSEQKIPPPSKGIMIRRCHAAESQLTAIRDLLTPLLGTETCLDCTGNGRVEMLEHCKPCHGTGERNIADGLNVVECVKRIAKYKDAFVKDRRAILALSEAIRPDIDITERGICTVAEATAVRTERDELRTEKKILDAMYKEQEEQVEACGRFLGLDDGSVNWTDGLWEKIRIKLEQLTEMRAERDKLCEQVSRLREWVARDAVSLCLCAGNKPQCRRCSMLAATAPKEPARK